MVAYRAIAQINYDAALLQSIDTGIVPKPFKERFMKYSEEDIAARQNERDLMVDRQIIARNVAHPQVIAAMRKVPRHLFVSLENRYQAYGDHPVPIGCGQTISQPYMVAAMTEMLTLTGEARVLEIGTGSGYQTAILAEIARDVLSIERHATLADGARERLDALGYEQVRIVVADGSLGWPECAPYDVILVAAGAPRMPQTLCEQLAEGGRLVAPVGEGDILRLVTVQRKGGAFLTSEGMGCRFVPLVGAQGWPEKG